MCVPGLCPRVATGFGFGGCAGSSRWFMRDWLPGVCGAVSLGGARDESFAAPFWFAVVVASGFRFEVGVASRAEAGGARVARFGWVWVCVMSLTLKPRL